MKRVWRKLLTMAENVELEINDEKTEYLMISCQGREY